MANSSLLVVILAAGMGTRMKSSMPKVLHKIGGLSMVGHVIKTCLELNASKFAFVVGPNMEDVSGEISSHIDNAELFTQVERLGTAHAVLAARSALESHNGPVLVLYGDTPLLTPSSLQNLLDMLEAGADVGVLGFEADDPSGYGRIVQNQAGDLIAIREEKDASADEQNIKFCNSGVMAFGSGHIIHLLDQIGNENAKGEYYLTDSIEIAHSQNLKTVASQCREDEVLGVNDRIQLSEAESIFQHRMRVNAQRQGATLIAPETVFFSHDTDIGTDVIIEPHVIFGPNVKIANGVKIAAFSHIEGAELGEKSIAGPFARLRPGTKLGEGAKVGNFVETKNANVAMGAKINHLSYIGDAEVGEDANVGAGTITCNYDGFFKHKTVIGQQAFIGSNSSLIAPVTIGDGAYIGSGSVISRDVESDSLALTRAERQTIEGWAARFKKSQMRKKSAPSSNT